MFRRMLKQAVDSERFIFGVCSVPERFYGFLVTCNIEFAWKADAYRRTTIVHQRVQCNSTGTVP
jgi:hypothetical protein